MLCQACVNMWSRVGSDSPGSWSGEKPTMFDYPQHGLVWSGAHHIEPDAFLMAVTQNCYICCTIYRDSTPEMRKEARAFHLFYQVRMLEGDSHESEKNHYELEFTVEILDVQPPFTRKQIFECTGVFRILPKTDISAPSEPLGLTENTFTVKCRDQVLQWLTGCVKSHKRCQKDWRITRSDPARLINITREGWFSLETIDSRRSCPQYVTLSHCWDVDATTLTLETKTAQSLRQGMPTALLPARFRDAIEIARWMGMGYIWIDALCIVQDSDVDWLDQSTKMGDIYTNSYCNIAATNAGHNKGCFTKRMTKMVEPYSITDPRSTNPSETHVIGYDDFWSNSLLDPPLHNRGWVLQELLTSRRTIHCGQEQIFWECRCEMACEAYPKGIPEQFRNRKTRAWRLADDVFELHPKILQPGFLRSCIKYESYLIQTPNSTPVLAQLVKVYGTWSKIVERYMECKLSFRQDKLIAISGIAQKIAAITGETYLAGLWNNRFLPQSLLWYVLARRQADNTPAVRNVIPDYTGPSWSWASLEARVIWNWPVECGETLIQIVDTHVNEVEGSRLGRVLSATINLSGSLFGGTLEVMNKDSDGALREDGQYLLQLTDTIQNSQTTTDCGITPPVIEPRVHLDIPLLPASSCVKTYLLPMCTEWQGWSGITADKLAGLLLVKSRDSLAEPKYERIGVFGMDKEQAEILCGVTSGKHSSIEQALLATHKDLITLM